MLALLAFLFATRGGGELDRRSFTVGLVFALLLFASVLAHELAHAAAARAYGRQVHEVVLTLWGGHTTFDARGITPLVSGVTALVGPLANLALAGVGAFALSAMGLSGTLGPMVSGDLTLAGVLTYLVYVNVILAVFNALPGIPMDGGRVLEAIVWRVTDDRYRGVIVGAWAGRIIALGVGFVALALPVSQGRTPVLFDLLWAVLVFVILWPAASAALKGAQQLSRRQHVSAGSIMVPAVAVKFDVSVEVARHEAHSAGAREVVVLAADGVPAGHFPVSLTDAVPAEQRAEAGLESVTMPLPRGTDVTSELTGDELLTALREWWGQTDVWTVADSGRIVGVVRLVDVMNALQ